jgi:hypothetical protein
MGNEVYCEIRSRDCIGSGKVGPWMACTRKAAKEAVSTNGRRYPLCSFHFQENKDDPRFVRFESLKK